MATTMTGPEHYKRAQQLEELAVRQWERGSTELAVQLTMPQAQLHATLALAATQAESTGSPDKWEGVIT